MGIDFHLIANFAALALITLAGPAVVFILFYRRGALVGNQPSLDLMRSSSSFTKSAAGSRSAWPGASVDGSHRPDAGL